MVHPAITLKLSDRTPKRGQRVRFSGQLCPEHDSTAVELQRKTSSGWKKVASPVLADIPGAHVLEVLGHEACPPKRVLSDPLQRGRGPRRRQQPTPAREDPLAGSAREEIRAPSGWASGGARPRR